MTRRFIHCNLTILCALALPLLAQPANSSQSQASSALDSTSTSASGARVYGVPVEALRRNQPLSLSLTSTGVQTLADGTKLTQTRHSRMYRDSSGRVRVESFYDSGKLSTISLIDPLAGKIMYLRVVGKQALSMDYESSRMMQALAAHTAISEKRPSRQGETTEPLPPTTMQGFVAEGIRRTRTIPPGTSGWGNDRTVSLVIEEWFSPQLGIDLQESTKDPRTGETTVIATDIQLKEPDPSLFQVPADYKLVTQ